MRRSNYLETFLGFSIAAIILLSIGISNGGSFIIYDMYDGFIVVGTISVIMAILMIVYWIWQRWNG